MATTVVNTTPAQTGSDSNGMGFILGIIVLVAFVGILFYFGLPYIQHGFGGGVQVNVPKSIDINVKQSK